VSAILSTSLAQRPPLEIAALPSAAATATRGRRSAAFRTAVRRRGRSGH
jgi:hypothetical protein